MAWPNTTGLLRKLLTLPKSGISPRWYSCSSLSLPRPLDRSMQFIDIGANLTDGMYSGFYHGSSTPKHPGDLSAVLDRAWEQGIRKIMVTGGSLEDSRKALELAQTHENLSCTVGCHPTRCQEFDSADSATSADAYLAGLADLIDRHPDKVVALGELGLDYERLKFCPKETQLKYFEQQLNVLSDRPGRRLPLFLHCRNAASDLVSILKRCSDKLLRGGGVVHSFDGTKEEAEMILELGYCIGINGCSLKTEANLDVVKIIPSDRLMLETDCPWCDIRPSHAGSKMADIKKLEQIYPSVKKEKWKEGARVKGRNEPCTIVNVLEVVAAVKEEDPADLCDTIYETTKRIFFSHM